MGMPRNVNEPVKLCVRELHLISFGKLYDYAF